MMYVITNPSNPYQKNDSAYTEWGGVLWTNIYKERFKM